MIFYNIIVVNKIFVFAAGETCDCSRSCYIRRRFGIRTGYITVFTKQYIC